MTKPARTYRISCLFLVRWESGIARFEGGTTRDMVTWSAKTFGEMLLKRFKGAVCNFLPPLPPVQWNPRRNSSNQFLPHLPLSSLNTMDSAGAFSFFLAAFEGNEARWSAVVHLKEPATTFSQLQSLFSFTSQNVGYKNATDWSKDFKRNLLWRNIVAVRYDLLARVLEGWAGASPSPGMHCTATTYTSVLATS